MKRKILIVFDDMIADMINNKLNNKLNPVATELFIRGRKLSRILKCHKMLD